MDKEIACLRARYIPLFMIIAFDLISFPKKIGSMFDVQALQDTRNIQLCTGDTVFNQLCSSDNLVDLTLNHITITAGNRLAAD